MNITCATISTAAAVNNINRSSTTSSSATRVIVAVAIDGAILCLLCLVSVRFTLGTLETGCAGSPPNILFKSKLVLVFSEVF